MKAQERHELKQNDLASWLQYGLPMFLKQNGSYVVLILAIALLAYQVYHWYQRKQEALHQTAWVELQQAQMAENPPARWQGIIDTYDYPDLKVQAYLGMGTFYSRLTLFPEQMTIMKITRAEALDKAYDAFKHARDTMPGDALVNAKAILGMAAVDEDRGDWDAARKEYQELATGTLFVKTPFVDFAQDRLATLDQRRDAPRLAAMIPTPPASQPAGMVPAGELGPQLLGGMNFPNFTAPSLPGGTAATTLPVEAPSTAPATAPAASHPG